MTESLSACKIGFPGLAVNRNTGLLSMLARDLEIQSPKLRHTQQIRSTVGGFGLRDRGEEAARATSAYFRTIVHGGKLYT